MSWTLSSVHFTPACAESARTGLLGYLCLGVGDVLMINGVTLRRPNYGFMWWLTPEDDAEPGTPIPVFAARGYGSNIIWVDSEHDLVVVLRWFGGNAGEFFGPLVESAEKSTD